MGVVRRYTFTTHGQVREIAVMRQSHSLANTVRWYLYLDDEPAASEEMDSSSTEFHIPFFVGVGLPGTAARTSVAAFISMEKAQDQSWESTLVVHHSQLQPSWTLEEGDQLAAEPLEVLDKTTQSSQSTPAVNLHGQLQSIHEFVDTRASRARCGWP